MTVSVLEPLDLIAQRVEAAYSRGEDLILTAARDIQELQRRVHGGEYAGTWTEFCAKHLPRIKERRIRQLLAIARAPDPRAALLESRESEAERLRDLRERQADAVESAVRTAGFTPDDEPISERSYPDPRDTIDEALGITPHVRGTFGTGDNEWYTPAEHIERARKVLGVIDLDPATSEFAQQKVRAKRFFTLADDGLKQEWSGRVWLNPPYAQPAISHFADKFVVEISSGRVTGAIMLTHNYTDTAWFHQAESVADAICFTRGRIRFEAADGSLAAPTQGQAFFYYGDKVDLFRSIFGEVGFVR